MTVDEALWNDPGQQQRDALGTQRCCKLPAGASPSKSSSQW